MGFVIHYHGTVHAVHNIQVDAGAVVHIGGDASPPNKGRFSKENTCPIKTTKEQRTEWGAACAADHIAPEGWSVETFSSEKAFANNKVPVGLEKGNAIFYYREGVAEDEVPSGFIAAYQSGEVLIIIPAGGDDLVDNEGSDQDLRGSGDDFQAPQETLVIDDYDEEYMGGGEELDSGSDF